MVRTKSISSIGRSVKDTIPAMPHMIYGSIPSEREESIVDTVTGPAVLKSSLTVVQSRRDRTSVKGSILYQASRPFPRPSDTSRRTVQRSGRNHILHALTHAHFVQGAAAHPDLR